MTLMIPSLHLLVINPLPGEVKYPKLIPSEAFTFSDLTPFLQGEDKRLYTEFASKMLRSLPEERLTAKQLYNDPWLGFKPEVDQKGSW